MKRRYALYQSWSKKEKQLFREAMYKSMYCKILLSVKSFKKASIKFSPYDKINAEYNTNQLKELSKAVLRSEKALKWKNGCLVSTLVLRWMLNDRKITSKAFLGVDNNETFNAHAWIEVDDIELLPKGENFHILYEF